MSNRKNDNTSPSTLTPAPRGDEESATIVLRGELAPNVDCYILGSRPEDHRVSKRAVVAALTPGRKTGHIEPFLSRIPAEILAESGLDTPGANLAIVEVTTDGHTAHTYSATDFVRILTAYTRWLASGTMRKDQEHLGRNAAGTLAVFASAGVVTAIRRACGVSDGPALPAPAPTPALALPPELTAALTTVATMQSQFGTAMATMQTQIGTAMTALAESLAAVRRESREGLDALADMQATNERRIDALERKLAEPPPAPPAPAPPAPPAPVPTVTAAPVPAPAVTEYYSIEAERAVLGRFFIANPSEIGAILEQLRPEDFYYERGQVLFQAFQSLYRQGVMIDPIAVRQALLELGEYEKIGGAKTLHVLIEHYSTGTALPHHIRTIVEKSNHRLLDAHAEPQERLETSMLLAHLDRTGKMPAGRGPHLVDAAVLALSLPTGRAVTRSELLERLVGKSQKNRFVAHSVNPIIRLLVASNRARDFRTWTNRRGTVCGSFVLNRAD